MPRRSKAAPRKRKTQRTLEQDKRIEELFAQVRAQFSQLPAELQKSLGEQADLYLRSTKG